MLRPASIRAFSLLEVIIAIALFTASVTVILALLPGLSHRASETADRLTAQRLPEAVRVELTRIAVGGFDGFASLVPEVNDSPVGGFALVATRNGMRVQTRGNPAPAETSIADGDEYFLIECWKFPEGPLRYDDSQAALALAVRISWPIRGDAPAGGTEANEFRFVISLNRWD